MMKYDIVFDKTNGVITAKLRGKCSQSGNWETIYSQDVTNAINMIKKAQNTIDNTAMLQSLCGSCKKKRGCRCHYKFGVEAIKCKYYD